MAATKAAFPTGTTPAVVYLVSGTSPWESLSATPAAVYEVGAVLLVRPDGIPSVVVSELKRLAPASIVVVVVLVGLLYLVAGSLTHESPRFRHLPPSAHPAH